MTTSIRIFRYQGLSMWPCFQEGDLLELAPVKLNQIRIGDCVAYRSTGGKQAVHRVVGKRNGLMTRGDALAGVDHEAVQANQVIGRVVLRHRLGQERRIQGGLRGRFAGLFYRYAGRLDPQRPSRGGRFARFIRTASTKALKFLPQQGVSRSMALSGGEKFSVWELQGQIIARRDLFQSEWRVAWPWSIFVEVPKGLFEEEAQPIVRRSL